MNNKFFCRLMTLLISAVLLSACQKDAEPTAETPPLRLVKTLTISPSSDSQWRELPGVVDVDRKADLNFRMAGKLEKLRVNEGDLVKSGQILAQLDATDLNLQKRSREAEYQQVHADYLRSKSMVEKGLISRSDFNKLQAQNVTAKTNLSTAKQNVSYTFLRAPFGGRISKRHIENYEEVSAAQPIYSIQDPDTLTIKVAIPESMMVKGQKHPPEISAEFDTIPGERFKLSPKEVATQADPNTRTYEVTLEMPDLNGHNILPGMSVTVRGERPANPSTTDTVTIFVPAQAVLDDTDGQFVYLVNSSGNNLGVIERREVSIGKLSSSGIKIEAGLETGNRIVVAGMSKMYPGLEVRAREEDSQ